MTAEINVALLGSKFMGRIHSSAWLKAAKIFSVNPRPVMHTVAARNAEELMAFAKTWGWRHATTDWRSAVTSEEVGLVDIGTPNDVHAVRGADNRH